MSALADSNRERLDDELSGLALSAVRVLKKFLDTDDEPSELQLQQVKAAAPSLSAWAKWEQTSTNRSVLQESVSRRTLASVPIGSARALTVAQN